MREDEAVPCYSPHRGKQQTLYSSPGPPSRVELGEGVLSGDRLRSVCNSLNSVRYWKNQVSLEDTQEALRHKRI